MDINTRRSNIPIYEPDLGDAERAYVLDCIDRGWISGIGEYVERFEQKFSRFCNARHGIATCNGTVALDLALATLGIGGGDEVIVPNLTFAATANAVRHVDADPVLVDCEPHTWNIDPARIEAVITPRTRAIVAVHLYGHPANMDPILDVARRYGLYVIEDAAEAHGALYRGRRVGALGDIGCFSFYANKIITAGEGGMLVINDDELASRARLLRGQAMDPNRRYWHTEVGYNFRMTNLQAAIGLGQLERIESILQRKREIAMRYYEGLQKLPGVVLPPEAEWAKNVFWMYSILIDPAYGSSRDAVCDNLAQYKIDTRPFFYPLSALPPFQHVRTGDNCAVSYRLSAQGLNLPSSPRLYDQDIDRVVDAIALTLDAARNLLPRVSQCV